MIAGLGDGRDHGGGDDARRTLVTEARVTFHGVRPDPDEPAPLPPPPMSTGVNAEEATPFEPTRVQDSRAQTTPPLPAPPLIPGVAPAHGALATHESPGVPIGGRYTIERTLGEGGMGKVYEVRHQQLGKSFALKLIQSSLLSNPTVRDKFFQEARLASSLDHPNIVSIVDFGEDPVAGTFMVMELLDGEPLFERLAGKPLQLKPALDVVFQVAEALHYIHERGIVHCDIKSDNILLCRVPTSTERRKWQVKLLDFGVARVQAKDARRTGSLEGTPAYIAPERIEGLAPQQSMDIYGLGVLAYELITGAMPFVGNIAQVLMAHRDTEPPPFSAHVGDAIDERVEALVMRALAKNPAARQRDMSAFLYELRTAMDMLGFTARARKRVRDARGVHKKDRKAAGIQFGYQASPVPMAAIDADGTVIVANRAFARFLAGTPDAPVEGATLYDGPLEEFYPALRRDVERVHTTGETRHRVLGVPDDRGGSARLVAWLVPGTEDAGEVHITIHSADAG